MFVGCELGKEEDDGLLVGSELGLEDGSDEGEDDGLLVGSKLG